MPPALTTRALGRATLARQLLLAREPVPVLEAVRRVLALQAQQPASPYLALWNRVADLDLGDVDAAFADGRLVKATLVRLTLHAVVAEDHPVLREAVLPSIRASRLGDRFLASGLTTEDLEALVPELLALAEQPRTTAEVETWIADRCGGPRPGAWWGLRAVAPLRHAPTGGPWSFGLRPAYLAAPYAPLPGGPDAALEVLARRYLAAFGPATVADLAQFAMVQRSRARAALTALGDSLERFEGPDGQQLYDVPGAPLPDETAPAPPRLLGMWDSVLLAHADRSRVVPPEHRKLVTRVNGDLLPTLLVDGRVVGVWRTVDGAVEATAFEPLAEDDWAGLAEEASALLAVLAPRDLRPYGRYDHWWAKLPPDPAGGVRLLGAG